MDAQIEDVAVTAERGDIVDAKITISMELRKLLINPLKKSFRNNSIII